jgi:hypothetical protein
MRAGLYKVDTDLQSDVLDVWRATKGMLGFQRGEQELLQPSTV